MMNPRVLVAILTLQTLMILGIWFGGSQSAALAQIPDQGAQLSQLIEQTKSLNTKMDRIISILESGKMQVKVEQPAKENAR